MTTPTDTNRDLLTVIAHMRAKPGKEDELRRELEALVEPTTQEDGFVNYDLHVAVSDDGSFYLYENWESEEKLDAHLETPHLERFAGLLDDLLEGGSSGLHINRLRRIA
jgi:quinol monooxygenase YgiN